MKHIHLLLFFFLILTMHCARKPEFKIGVSVASMSQSVYSFMKEAIEKQAAKDDVAIVWLSADNNEENQAANIDRLLAQKVNAIILHSVNDLTSATLVTKIKTAGVPVVTMDRLPLNAPVDLHVTADSYKVGILQAEYLVKTIHGKGNVIILQGDTATDVAREITRGNMDILKKYPNISIILNLKHIHWNRERANATIEDALLKYQNDITGILANNSSMAMGGIQALKAQGIDNSVVCIGADADFDALQSIKNGELAADVDKNPIDIGLESYKAAVALVQNRPVDFTSTILNGTYEVKVKLVDVRLITKENIETMKYRWKNL